MPPSQSSRALRLRPHSDASGFTLVELLVAMALFTIFISIFITAMVALMRGTSQAKVTAESSSQSLVIFQNIDRQVRYADAINYPGDGPSGARYIEYRIPAASSPTSKDHCYQWRFMPDSGQVQTRQWDDLPSASPGPWTTKLVNAQTPATTDGYPFELIPAEPGKSTKQQFVLTLNAGSEAYDAHADVTSVFVARNSSEESPSNDDSNGDGASDTPVCLTTGDRP